MVVFYITFALCFFIKKFDGKDIIILDMGKRQKFYVVWEGHKPGIYDNWSECSNQVNQFQGAKYKSFDTEAEAKAAFARGYKDYFKTGKREGQAVQKAAPVEGAPQPVLRSLSVDAAWNSVTKVMEYRGVYTATGKEWFHKGPFKRATNNVGEFLALVHGLAFLKQRNLDIPIYSDSITAISWVRRKKHNSVILPTEENEEVILLLERAEQWLRNNTYATPIYKWNTPLWGEIPADFGRK